MAYGLTFRDVLEALARNNASVGAGYFERSGEQSDQGAFSGVLSFSTAYDEDKTRSPSWFDPVRRISTHY